MCEVQDIFAEHGEAYRLEHEMSAVQEKAFDAIRRCRTSALGGHIDVCPECGAAEQSYNSCRNRHCPKCQSYKMAKWVEEQSRSLLDIPYFHVVFTVPEELNVVFMHNQAEMYGLLFRASAKTLAELCADEKYLGARGGHTAVLHTWGQNLSYHPHVHCIVPSGGLTEGGGWKNSSAKFFLPVKVVSAVFRGKLLDELKGMRLRFYNAAAALADPEEFARLVDALYLKDWVVYCKRPFGNSAAVVGYLGSYTHRVAISNARVISCEGGVVRFRWRDYRDGGKVKVMELSAVEFIRRFLMHILPKGFMKVRHYGLLSNSVRGKKIGLMKRLTGTPLREYAEIDPAELVERLIGRPPGTCRYCGAGLVGYPLLA